MYKSEVYSDKDPNIYARVVEDSVANGIRLVTLELQMHRFILAQFNTHRVFSRNASSSRAIPVKKNLDKIIKNPAYPIHWGKNQKGMQAKDDHDELVDILGMGYEKTFVNKKDAWATARDEIYSYAYAFMDAGYHKQIVNRLLEPFSYVKVIVTATEWDNFFNLRLHEDAQPEIQALAEVMKAAMEESTPEKLYPGEWHLPYVMSAREAVNFTHNRKEEEAIKMSVARTARVSFMNHDNTNPDIDKDMKLHDTLLNDGHMSCFEHQAIPMRTGGERWYDSSLWEDGVTHLDRDGNFWSGNLRGFIQYRQLV